MVSGFSDLSIARQEKRSLYVSGLPFGTSEKSVEAAFTKHGFVEKVNMLPRYNDKTNCSCFVIMATNAEAMICVKELDGSYFEERRISVNFPKPPKRTKTIVEDQDACVEINGFPATTTATYISEAVSACEFDVVTVKILRHETMGDTHVALVFLSSMDHALKCVEAFDTFVVQDQQQRRYTLTARIKHQTTGNNNATGPPVEMPAPGVMLGVTPPPGIMPPPGSWQPPSSGIPTMPPPPPEPSREAPRRQRWDVTPPPPPTPAPEGPKSRRRGTSQPPPHMKPPPGFPSQETCSCGAFVPHDDRFCGKCGQRQDRPDDWDDMEEVPEPPPEEHDEDIVYAEPPETETYFEPPAEEGFEEDGHSEPAQGYFEDQPEDYFEPLDAEPAPERHFEPSHKRQRYW
jgi:hypothetical protein